MTATTRDVTGIEVTLQKKIYIREFQFNYHCRKHILSKQGRGATRILLRGGERRGVRLGLKMEDFCDVIFMTYFR